MKAILKKSILALAFLALACTEDAVKPVVPDAENWVAPALTSSSSEDVIEFTTETATEVYDQFSWWAAQYGIDVSAKYVIQIDNDEDFSSPKDMITQEGSGQGQRSVSVTVEKFNSTVLSLGVPGFTEATIYIRIKSSINGMENDPIYSNVISRVIKTYQDSECGNYCTVGIIGGATTGSDGTGWNNDIDLRIADPTNKTLWSGIVYLYSGFGCKFRASDSWDTNWGSAAFPTGTGTQNGDNISISTSGYYKITFDDATGAYSFTLQGAPTYTTIGVIGSGTTGTGEGWNADIDLTKDSNDPHLWKGTFTLFTGEIKFRAENDWGTNWGSNTYPSGYSVGNGANIPIAAGGDYYIVFNDATGVYHIGSLGNAGSYSAIGVIGSATTGTNEGWNADLDMIQNPAEPYKWSKIFTLYEGEAKFRADNDWAINWGATGFPGGKGGQNGANVPVKEGTYFVTFNTLTGEYYFLR
jgi:SusE outer membrane protein/Outer membrane protein SusF_SusE